MKSNLLIGVLVASMFALPAWAGGVHGHGSGSGSGSPVLPTNSSSSSATGGAGGAGGAATGGSATGGAATGGASNVSVSVGTGSGSASPGVAALGAVGAPGSSAYNTQATVQYGGDYTVKNVPTSAPPALTTTLSDTCMGSVSLGVSAVGFGVTGGMTMVDEACVRRLDSREFRAMGMNDVALALLCQSDANRKAIEATGRTCPSVPKQAAAGEVQTYSVSAQNSSEQYTDPVVRKRMGLEPLP
ncbi:histidine kinase [Herminiimonas glaciei]|uniref:Histidine kinase n=1 Tax=Herminiimonas glaciei TaxID=523788 RepID=A0ABW2I9F5_9BURK